MTGRWRARAMAPGVVIAVIVAVAVIATVAVVVLATRSTGSTHTSGTDHPSSPGPPSTTRHTPDTYLALGDSIAFGYRPPGAVPTPHYHEPSSFVGYPELLARTLDLRVSNAACPGETVTSMISTTAVSNGCENTDGRPGGYRTRNPLHVDYRGSQLAYAVAYLSSHHHVALVTIGIGLNDVAICRDRTKDRCGSSAELHVLTSGLGRHLDHVLTSLRDQARYHGRIVAVTYYAKDYTDRADLRTTTAIDAVISAVARQNHALVANGFAAFDRESAAHRNDLCATGLLIRLPKGRCDLHPSHVGQALLASTVRAALGP